MRALTLTCCAIVAVLLVRPMFAQESAASPAIRFNKNFEGASIGKIVAGDQPGAYRLHIVGQYDQRGRNRQTTWFSFRMDNVKGRPLALTFTDWVGEYNDKPGACPMRPGIVPVFSYDGRNWAHFDEAATAWDNEAKELAIKFTPEQDSVWLAHIPPYTPADLAALLREVEKSPHAVVETIGRTLAGRDLPMVTVTDLAVPDEAKKVVWLQARQHAWEAGTSWVMEGALRFVTSDDPAAVELRKKAVFKFTPLVDLDGAAAGNVRFNGNGFDVNRHWDVVDLRDAKWLRLMPEIWYTKRAILAAHRAKPIDMMVNLHNTETGEFVQTQADDEAVLKRMRRFEDLLVEKTIYDPSGRLTIGKGVSDTNTLWHQAKVPVMLMELRIARGKKLGRCPTIEDRAGMGRGLMEAMAAAVTE